MTANSCDRGVKPWLARSAKMRSRKSTLYGSVGGVLLIATMGLVSCRGGLKEGEGDGRPPIPEGIPVVAIPIESLAETPKWGDARTPEVVVGGSDEREGYAFSRPPAGVLLPGGGFALSDALAGEIRIFSDSGKLTRSCGGLGSGPGEFRALNWVGLNAAGELVAWDAVLARLSVFTLAGKFKRSFEADPRLAAQRNLDFLGFFRDGSFPLEVKSGRSPIPRNPSITLFEDTLRIRRFESTGTAGGELFVGQGNEHFVYRSGDGAVMVPPIFGATQLEAVTGDHLYVTSAKDGTTWKVSTTGDTVAVWVFRGQRRHASTADVDSIRAQHLSALKNSGLPELFARAWESVPAESDLPMIQHVASGHDGLIWFGMYATPIDTVRTWYGLREDGQPAFQVTLPRTAQILDVDEHRILTRSLDELDRPSVSVYIRRDE